MFTQTLMKLKKKNASKSPRVATVSSVYTVSVLSLEFCLPVVYCFIGNVTLQSTSFLEHQEINHQLRFPITHSITCVWSTGDEAAVTVTQ